MRSPAHDCLVISVWIDPNNDDPTTQNKGPIPFGAEPSASDFAMLVLFMRDVSIVLVEFSTASF
jgi:hypothetical protein